MMLILRPDVAGVLRDRSGQAYNEDGQRIDEHGNVIPEIAHRVDRHQLGVARHHVVNRADGRQMTLGDYNSPGLFYENRRAIRPPAFERSDDLGLQPAFYTLVSQHPFHGLPHEQPMDHIERFEDLVSIIKARVVSEDYLLRKLFSYSLAGEAASWLQELITGSLTTWQETKMAFLNNFTRNYCSYSYQATSPPTSVSKMESMPEQIQESQQRILEISPLGRIESNLTTSSHAVLKESEDEFVEVEGSEAEFVTAPINLEFSPVIEQVYTPQIPCPMPVIGQAFSVQTSTNTVVETEKVVGTSEQPQEARVKSIAENRSTEMDVENACGELHGG
ncbi:unnamed protein product [Arabidopsis arenosa]|uniref:Retrotransposon gag domain-containing protein n=1 Tax=Arabidopsis arenosa TaxID=38785 RepID=A0A8S1ZI76_ARAAE|nr:unnamed protein product [Arabidopsis arenosa]